MDSVANEGDNYISGENNYLDFRWAWAVDGNNDVYG